MKPIEMGRLRSRKLFLMIGSQLLPVLHFRASNQRSSFIKVLTVDVLHCLGMLLKAKAVQTRAAHHNLDAAVLPQALNLRVLCLTPVSDHLQSS